MGNNICDKYAIYSDVFDAITTPCETESESVIYLRVTYILIFSGASKLTLSYFIFLVRIHGVSRVAATMNHSIEEKET